MCFTSGNTLEDLLGYLTDKLEMSKLRGSNEVHNPNNIRHNGIFNSLSIAQYMNDTGHQIQLEKLQLIKRVNLPSERDAYKVTYRNKNTLIKNYKNIACKNYLIKSV